MSKIRIYMLPYYLTLPFRLPKYFFQLMDARHKAWREIGYILFHVGILLFSFFVQLNIIRPIPALIVRDIDKESFFLGVYQIQATVSTLGIAVISLITGLITEKYYGITVTNYVLNIKPKVLKFKYLIVVNLLYILLNLYFCAMKFYNFVGAVTISSVLLCIKMTLDTYRVITRGKDYKSEIKDYLLGSESSIWGIRQTPAEMDHVMSVMEEEIGKALPGNRDAVFDCLGIVGELAEAYVDNTLRQKAMEDDEKKNCMDFLNRCNAVIRDVLDARETIYLATCIKGLGRLFKQATRLEMRLEISHSTMEKLCDQLSICDPGLVWSEECIRAFHGNMFNNLSETSEMCKDAIMFLYSLYNALLKNMRYMRLPGEKKVNMWAELVKVDILEKSAFSMMAHEYTLYEPRKLELLYLFKAMIDENEIEILAEVLPIEYGGYTNLNRIIHMYLYGVTQKKSTQIEGEQLNKISRAITWQNCAMYYYYYRDINAQVEEILSSFRHIDDIGRKKRRQVFRHMEVAEFEFLLFYILLAASTGDESNAEIVLNVLLKHNYDKEMVRSTFDLDDQGMFFKRYKKFADYYFPDWERSKLEKATTTYAFCKRYFVEALHEEKKEESDD